MSRMNIGTELIGWLVTAIRSKQRYFRFSKVFSRELIRPKKNCVVQVTRPSLTFLAENPEP